MPTCNECKCFFVRKEDTQQGDCVQRVVDPRQAYYKAQPVRADQEVQNCTSFQKK
jgi:benzylsuccinate synthase